MNCPVCGLPNSDMKPACMACGACLRCGAFLSIGAVRCLRCADLEDVGNEVKPDSSTEEGASPNVGKEFSTEGLPQPTVTGETSAGYRDPVSGVELVGVPGGSYTMGDLFGNGEGDEHTHRVSLGSFLVGRCPVTQTQWQAVMGTNPSQFVQGSSPVDSVSWQDVEKFLWKLGERCQLPFRLPTEAEWEYAARSAGRPEVWPGTCAARELDSLAWNVRNSGGRTRPVGKKHPNGLDLHDMAGNVWEWCSDWYAPDYYESSPEENPAGPESGNRRVLRGGSWESGPKLLRSANRYSLPPGDSNPRVGFRLALSAASRES